MFIPRKYSEKERSFWIAMNQEADTEAELCEHLGFDPKLNYEGPCVVFADWQEHRENCPDFSRWIKTYTEKTE